VYLAEARLHRAAQYSKLVNKFGDVVYSDNVISIEDAYSKGRTNRKDVTAKIYEDFDFAIKFLPTSYAASALKRASKGVAMSLKARHALCEKDYKIAADYELIIRFFLIHKITWKYSNITTTSMLIGGVSSSGVKSYNIVTEEISKALKINSVKFSKLILRLRIVWKVFELFKK
jgi:hypothetical protein